MFRNILKKQDPHLLFFLPIAYQREEILHLFIFLHVHAKKDAMVFIRELQGP